MSRARRYLVDLATSGRLDLGRDELRSLETRVNAIASTDRRYGLLIGLGVLGMIAMGWGLGLTLMWVGRIAGLPKGVGIAAAGVLTPALLIPGWFLVFTPLLRGAVRRALRELGHDVCATCGYTLAGLPERDGVRVPCPECGRKAQPPLGELDAPRPDAEDRSGA